MAGGIVSKNLRVGKGARSFRFLQSGNASIIETVVDLNYALIEWSDNIEISDSSPQEYLPQFVTRFSPDELKDMCYWHALPDGWENMTYENFFKARRKAIAKIIREGFQRLSGGLEY